MNNIILIGLMGSGKSTLAKMLGQHFKKPTLDTDDLIEKESQKSISEIFNKEGENYFRALETKLLMTFDFKDAIIATGGGMVLTGENRKRLKDLGYVIYLKARPETLTQHLIAQVSNRPLLSKGSLRPQIEKLYEVRKNWYEETANFIVEVDDLTLDEVFLLISENLNKLSYKL